MKQIIVMFLLIFTIFIVGCSTDISNDMPQRGDFGKFNNLTDEERQEKMDSRDFEDRPFRGDDFDRDLVMNMTEEERQAFMEEMRPPR